MKTLMAELLENNVSKRLEKQSLVTETSEEFIEALVRLCNGLDVDVPLWTYKEEKMLQKKKEVLVSVDPDNKRILKIHYE